MPCRSSCSGPSNGSQERNRTAAGTARSSSIRDVQRWFSTDTPIHTLSGQASRSASARTRSGRFVSTWKTCQSARRMTSNTSATYSSGTPSWNRSLMLLTKITRGLFQASGCCNRSGRSVRSKPGS